MIAIDNNFVEIKIDRKNLESYFRRWPKLKDFFETIRNNENVKIINVQEINQTNILQLFWLAKEHDNKLLCDYVVTRIM